MSRFESEQRARILEAAVGAFAAKGWKGATTRLIGGTARVNSALIYYYFENKHTLFQECIQLVLDRFLARLQRRKPSFSGARDRVRFLVDGVFSYFAQYPDRMQLIFLALNHFPALFGGALSAFLRTHALVPIEILNEGMARNELRRMNPIQTWWCILGMCVISLNMHRAVPSVDRAAVPIPIPRLEETKQQIADILESGIAVSGAGARGTRRTRP